MCGIFGYVGKGGHAASIALEGLKKLEYRGYDSAGIALLTAYDELLCCKQKGNVEWLSYQALPLLNEESYAAISHTRWATHGAPSERNAHPHMDAKRSLAIVHNGIIENEQSLRHELLARSTPLVSDTDTELVAHWLALLYEEKGGQLLPALQELLSVLEGAFSIALLHRDYPKQLFAFARSAPLAIALGKGESFVSSDPHAFPSQVQDLLFLGNNEIACLTAEKVEIYNAALETVEKQRHGVISSTLVSEGKGSFAHYTLKEIYDQPQSLRNTLSGRCLPIYGTATFQAGEELELPQLPQIERVLFLACGTSWHAAQLGGYLMEELACLPSQVEIASEFRYKNPIVSPATLVVAISQSGETADTLAAMREVQAKGCKVVAICNVDHSTMVREADRALLLRAGAEIGVCSTKAFTSQLVLLALLALKMARMRHMDKVTGQHFLEALLALPDQAQELLAQRPQVEALVDKYSHYEHFFFIGRRYMFPAALEAALKLKEISYIHASGYAAGEMKHGPIALIGPQCPTVALCANKQTFVKLQSNLIEIKSRQGPLLAFAEVEQRQFLLPIVEDLFIVPTTLDPLAPVLSSIALQLFAYEMARRKGASIDQPRNLAKSVTVE